LLLDAHNKFALPPRKRVELDGDDFVALLPSIAVIATVSLHARRVRLVIGAILEIMILLGIVFLAHPEHERVGGRGERTGAAAPPRGRSGRWFGHRLCGWRRVAFAVFHSQQRYFAVVAERDDLWPPQPPKRAGGEADDEN